MGKLNEDLNKSFSNYDETCADYGFTDVQKLKCLHNLLDGEAKQLFRSHAQYTSNRYQIAAGKMVAELDIITLQNRIRSNL